MKVFLRFDEELNSLQLTNWQKNILSYITCRNSQIINLNSKEENRGYENTLNLIKSCDICIIIMNKPDFTKGFYIAYALSKQKQTLVFSQKKMQFLRECTSPFLHTYQFKNVKSIKKTLSLYKL